jgi:hypothetical protein
MAENWQPERTISESLYKQQHRKPLDELAVLAEVL